MRPLRSSHFRAKRLMLEDKDFAPAPGKYPGPINLIQKATWNSLISLPDDVSIRTSDRYGPQLEEMWEYWGTWVRLVLAIQALTKVPTESPTAIAACDAGDEFQASAYCALVGYYRVAFSCLRNVLEQMTIAARLTVVPGASYFADWRNASERIGFGWAADGLPKSQDVAALEKHLTGATADSLFAQKPKGLARRLFVELSKYTHGAAGFTDADSRESNGPIFVPKAFLAWRVATLKTYAMVLHELKLAHPQLKDLPYGPPRMTFDRFRKRVVRKIPRTDKDQAVFKSLGNFWPETVSRGSNVPKRKTKRIYQNQMWEAARVYRKEADTCYKARAYFMAVVARGCELEALLLTSLRIGARRTAATTYRPRLQKTSLLEERAARTARAMVARDTRGQEWRARSSFQKRVATRQTVLNITFVVDAMFSFLETKNARNLMKYPYRTQ